MSGLGTEEIPSGWLGRDGKSISTMRRTVSDPQMHTIPVSGSPKISGLGGFSGKPHTRLDETKRYFADQFNGMVNDPAQTRRNVGHGALAGLGELGEFAAMVAPYVPGLSTLNHVPGKPLEQVEKMAKEFTKYNTDRIAPNSLAGAVTKEGVQWLPGVKLLKGAGKFGKLFK